MSGDLTNQRLWAVYLLHWHDWRDQAHHYVGLTEHSRIEARMREHQAGRGALQTAVIAAAGIEFDLARIFTTYNRELERTLIAHGRAVSKLCPVCLGAQALRHYRPTKRAAGLLPPLSSLSSLAAVNMKPGRETLTPEKKGRAEAATPLP